MVIGWFPDLCVADVAASQAFYVALVDLEVLVDHRWYVELGVGGRVALALVQRGHDTLPRQAGGPATGVLVSFEVDDVDGVAARAAMLRAPVIWPLTTELGQRHVMVADPDGTMVDVIQRVALRGPDRRRLAAYRRRADGGGG